MKTTILALLLFISAFVSKAHSVEKLCWNNGQYSFKATSVPSGSAQVKVYSNSNYTNLIQSFTMAVSGNQITYWVDQPIRTTKVYVKVTWSDGLSNWDPSGTNQCTLTPIIFGKIEAKNIGDNTEVTFQVSSTDEDNKITLNFNMPDGTTKYYQILFWDKLIYGDIWIISVNNRTGKYTIKKK